MCLQPIAGGDERDGVGVVVLRWVLAPRGHVRRTGVMDSTEWSNWS